MRTVYGIRDTTGALVAEHVRVDLPTGKRMYWRMPGSDGRAGLLGLSTPDLPLYRSEEIPYLDIGQPVVVCEGEAATDALWSLGIPALGTVTGASSTPSEDALGALLPLTAVLWPDHDREGYQHMNRVAHEITRIGGGIPQPRCIRPDLFTLRDGHLHRLLPKGYDAADFVAAGGRRATIGRLIREAVSWPLEPPVPPRASRPHPSYDRHDDGRVAAARAHLLQIVEERLGAPKWIRQGTPWWCCPFHAERTPSFKVDTREPFYRCFGCGARGDVFTFLEALDGIGFKDTLTTLAPPSGLGAMPRLWG